MTDRSNYQKVGVDVDEQSFNQLTQRANDAANSMSRLTQVNQSIADTAQQAGSRLQQAFASVKDNIDDDINSVAAFRAQLTGAADDAANLGKQTSGGGGVGGIGTFRRAVSAAGNLGVPQEVLRPLQIAGDLGQITKEFDQLSGSLKNAAGATEPLVAGLSAGTVAMGALAAAGAIFVGGLALIHSAYEDNTKIIQEAIANLDTYYAAIGKGTTDTIKAQLQAAEDHKKSVDDELNTIKGSQDNAFQAASKQYGDFGARLLFAAGQTGLYGDTLKDTSAKTADLTKQSADAQGQIDALNAALKSTQVAANDAAAAQNNYVKSLEAQKSHIQEVTKLATDGTSKQIQDRIDANKAQITADSELYASLSTISNPTKETTDEINRLRDEINQLTSDNKQLSGSALDLAKAREKETQAEKDDLKAAQAKLAADEKSQQAQVTAVEKYNTAIQAAEDQAGQARVAASDKLNQALVDAAQKAVDDANKALEQLEQKRQANLTSLTRDEDKETRDANDKLLNNQIQAQRQEANDLQTHLDNLKQIRDRDAGRQRDDLLNRNFRDLFALGEQKTQDINTENGRYTEQEEQRQQSLQQQQDDETRALSIQRRERLISYQQANADALAQYNLELQTAQNAKTKAIQVAQQGYQKDLQLITTTETQKENIAKQAAINEIKLAQQTADAKQAIFLNELQQADQLLGTQQTQTPYYSKLQTQRQAVPFADGGYANAGQLTKVNDKNSGQRESFKGVPFPPGLGLFIPATSGYINSGGSSGPVNFSPTYQITGVDAAQVAAIADAHNRKLMKDIGLLK